MTASTREVENHAGTDRKSGFQMVNKGVEGGGREETVWFGIWPFGCDHGVRCDECAKVCDLCSFQYPDAGY